MPKTRSKSPVIGVIGMGFVGSNYAYDFKKRGYKVVSFAKEAPYDKNKDLIQECDIVFIAVPTPTTPKGFDDSIIRGVLHFVGKGKIAVIKSTILPGTTESIQKENPDLFVLHSPEFLTEVTARHDAQNPTRNIVGIPHNSPAFKKKAREVISVLPKAPYELVCTSREAELIKYGGNCWFYEKVIFINELYNLAEKLGVKYDIVRDAMAADPRIGRTHLDPLHKSGRGAGGHCFIKDFAAFSELYAKQIPEDKAGIEHLRATEKKNIDLLTASNKDLELLEGVYGESILKKKP